MAKWQTHRTQNATGVTPCGFESRSRHQALLNQTPPGFMRRHMPGECVAITTPLIRLDSALTITRRLWAFRVGAGAVQNLNCCKHRLFDCGKTTEEPCPVIIADAD